ncbi:hypothetical protein KJZ61_01010 [Candidatus Dependentiae bacterium]|nr:hypothetical protein [Candidatus Dependentiae bacterium]
MKFSAIFTAAMCIVTSSLYSGHEGSIASTSASSEQSSLIIPLVWGVNCRVLGMVLSDQLPDGINALDKMANDVLGLYHQSNSEICSVEQESTPPTSTDASGFVGALVSYNEQLFNASSLESCKYEMINALKALTERHLEAPIRETNPDKVQALRASINSLLSFSQEAIQSQQKLTVEQRHQLKNHIGTIIIKIGDCYERPTT